MSEFAIGQKIVCVRDDWKNSVFGSSVRETGETTSGEGRRLHCDRP